MNILKSVLKVVKLWIFISAEKKLEGLIEKYEELKKNNKLQKHIEKRSKKLARKEFKNLRKNKTV